MGVHEKIRREDLKVEVFKSVTENHRLELCPKCGEKVEKPTCFEEFKDRMYGPIGSGSMRTICTKCNIVWELDLSNWKNDSLVHAEGHCISLEAFANCFCRTSLIDHQPDVIKIHEGMGHARFDSPCESRKRARGTVIMSMGGPGGGAN